MRVLIVEDDMNTQFVYEKLLRDSPYQIVAARSVRQATDALSQTRPAAVILDLVLRGEQSWQWLSQLKSNPATKDIPVIIVSTTEDQRKAFALGADAYLVKPIDRDKLFAQLDAFTRRRILLIDDDPAYRYMVRKVLNTNTQHQVIEAIDGGSGLEAAQGAHPQLIVLDLGLPDIDGEQVLQQLADNPLTREIPVVVATSRDLTPGEHATLARRARAVLNKRDWERDMLPKISAILSEMDSRAGATQ
jgi:CheY-like chemotaxis protein